MHRTHGRQASGMSPGGILSPHAGRFRHTERQPRPLPDAERRQSRRSAHPAERELQEVEQEGTEETEERWGERSMFRGRTPVSRIEETRLLSAGHSRQSRLESVDRLHLNADMGHFYTNITVKGPNQSDIAQVLAEQSRHALVSPSYGDLTVVFDEDSESQNGSVFELAKHLSRELRCIALAITNHDDSVLYYQVYERGELIDDYNSSPNYFDGPPVGPAGGDAEVLCRVFRASRLDLIESILRHNDIADPNDLRYAFEINRHRDLAAALSLPSVAVGYGLRYLAEVDKLPEGLDLTECRLIQGGPSA